MAPIFAPTIILPPYALALFIVVVVSVLAATTAWVFLAHRRRFSLRMPTTQVEAQVQVQVQVEKIHDPTPLRSSSWLGLPFTTCTTTPPSDTWFNRILRRHSEEPTVVALSDPPAAEKHTSTHPPLDDSQPPSPRPIKKEMWFAFDSDATLATLRGDPLGGLYCKPSCRNPLATSATSTPSLDHDRSTPQSPLSWEPRTPSPISEEDMARPILSIVPESPDEGDFGTIEETDHACPCPLLARQETRLSIHSVSMASSICTLAHDSVSTTAPGSIYLSEYEADCDADLKVSCKRLAALIDAISVSFSASTLGAPFSRRTTRLGFGDFDDNASSIGDDYDLPQFDDDDDPEWDLGTATLLESISHQEYSVLAI